MLDRYFPEIVDAVSQFGTDVVVDGELVLSRRGRFDFGALQDAGRLANPPRRP